MSAPSIAGAEANASEPIESELARKIPENVCFGTSSWTYPGWKGLIYKDEYKNDKDFRARSLGEYSRYPWFRTVGVDSFFYAPPTPAVLSRYAEQVGSQFQWVSKVWEEITIPHFAKHARYGKKAGLANPNFLNAEMFIERVLGPCSVSGIKEHVGPFVFEFQRLGMDLAEEPEGFYRRLDAFFAKLPKDFSYSTEIRNRELLTKDYFQLLNAHGVSHCFNHWSYMPPLVDQMRSAADAGGIDADFYVARLLTPLGMSYEQAVKKFSPYETLQAPQLEMRKDVIRLIRRAIERKVKVYILVNNRLEGHSPSTIKAIGKMFLESEHANEQSEKQS